MTALDRAQALSDRLVSVRTAHRQAEHQLAVLLTELAADGLHRVLGYASVGEYAVAVLDLDPRRARDLLRIGRALPELPGFAAAFAAGELGWTKARELVRVLTPQNEAAWVARAVGLTSRALEAELTHVGRGELPGAAADAETRAPARTRWVVELDAAEAELVQRAMAWMRAQAGLSALEVDNGATLGAMARKLLAEGEAEGAAPDERAAPSGERYRVVLEHCPACRQTSAAGAEVSDALLAEAACDAERLEMRPGPTQGHVTRAIPPATRRRVLHRARGRCEVPHCRSRLWLDVHHLRPRAHGGGHDDDNLLCACSLHHRAIHEGCLAAERGPRGEVVVTHADGRRLVGAAHVGQAKVAGLAAG